MSTKSIYNALLEEGFQKLTVVDSEGAIIEEITTTNTAAATAFANALTIATDSTVSFEIRVTGVEALTGDTYAYTHKGAAVNLAGAVSLVDTVLYESIAESAQVVTDGWDSQTNINGTTLQTRVYGHASKTIKWKASFVYNTITF